MGRKINARNAYAAQTHLLDPKGFASKLGIQFDFGSGCGAFGTGTIHVAHTPMRG